MNEAQIMDHYNSNAYHIYADDTQLSITVSPHDYSHSMRKSVNGWACINAHL